MRIILSITFLLLSLGLMAQQGLIKGKIVDAATGEGLLGVAVQSGSLVQTSDENGQFSMELPIGKHQLAIEAMGYEPWSQTYELAEGQLLEVAISLKESAILLQTTTITSSRFEKPLSEVVVSMEVIAPKLLENTNSVAVNEVLDKVPGLNMLDDQADIRGGAGYAQGTGSRVLILMDDLPVLQADAGLAIWRDLPTENIAQIEVLKGAASALYGSAAMNGIINIRTAYATDEPYTRVTLFGKLYDAPATPEYKWWGKDNPPYEAGLQAAHRRKVGKFDLVGGMHLFSNQGYMRGMRSNPFYGALDSMPNYERKVRLSLNTRYRHSERLLIGLNFNLNFGNQNRQLFWNRVAGSNLYEAAQEAVPIRGKNFRFTLDPSLTYFDSEGNRHRFQGRFYYINNDNENLQSNQSNNLYGEYQFQRRFEELGRLDLVGGIVGAHNAIKAEVYGNQAFTTSNFAAYLQLDKKFWGRLSLSAGVRYEYNVLNPGQDSVPYGMYGLKVASPDHKEGRPIFRFGANYQASEGTFVRASFGQAYRFPTLLEKYVSTSAGVLGVYPNPNLSSETGWSAELGVKQGFKLGKWQGFVDASIFRSAYQNMLEFQFNSNVFGFNVQNVGDTRITGAELSVAGQGKLGPVSLDLLTGYTYIDPIFTNFDSTTRENSTSEQNILKYRFKHSGKFDAQLGYKGFGLGGTVLYFSYMEAIDRYLETNFPTIMEFRETHQTGTLLVHLRASYEWKKRVKLSFLVQNVNNREYSIRPGLLEAPRNYSLRLDFTF